MYLLVCLFLIKALISKNAKEGNQTFHTTSALIRAWDGVKLDTKTDRPTNRPTNGNEGLQGSFTSKNSNSTASTFFNRYSMVFEKCKLMEVKLPYEPSCPSVACRSVSQLVGRSVIILSFTSNAPIRALVYNNAVVDISSSKIPIFRIEIVPLTLLNLLNCPFN